MPLDVARILDSDVYALATGDEFRAAFFTLVQELDASACSKPA